MTTATTAPADQFNFTRQTAVFLGVLAAFELAVVLVFPLIAVLFGALAVLLLVTVWIKAGRRTRKWLWWNPVAVPLTQVEGAIAVSAMLLSSVGVLLTGYEAIRFTSGERDVLTGYAFRHMLPRGPSSRPVGTRSTRYSDATMQQQLKDELAKAGIPFTLDTMDGKEYVVWTPEHNTAVDEIQRKMREGPLPDRRNVSFEDPVTQQEFKEWLLKRGISHKIVTMHGKEFVGWKDGPDDLAMQFMKERAVPCPDKSAAGAAARAEQTRC